MESKDHVDLTVATGEGTAVRNPSREKVGGVGNEGGK